MTTTKRFGWGLRILQVRSINGAPEALILPPDHEAPFWMDLRQIAQHQARARQIAQHQARTIYELR
jgi:hypothetical protein